jgi:hypothetical protein
MAELNSKMTREDLEVLIEAMGDWEALGNHEFHVLQMIKGAPLPPDDHEAYEIMAQIKEHYRKREKEIQASRAVRQERAVFVKAKLMLARIEIGTTKFFDIAQNVEAENPALAPQAEAKPPEKTASADSEKLALAEFFIRDLGVWDHYLKFLQERQAGE